MITLQDILDARVRIQGIVHNTPLTHAHAIGSLVGCALYLTAENLQRTGSFKIRGAANKMALLSAEERAGVIAANAGHHAQGVALAARETGVRATIVMPKDAPFAKVEATGNYGTEVLLHGGNFDEAMNRACELAKERGLTLIHAYDDAAVIAGQGTVGLEIAEALPSVDIVLVPVGGGGCWRRPFSPALRRPRPTSSRYTITARTSICRLDRWKWNCFWRPRTGPTPIAFWRPFMRQGMSLVRQPPRAALPPTLRHLTSGEAARVQPERDSVSEDI